MDIFTIIQKALLQGFANSELTLITMFVCIGITGILAAYIFCVYKFVNRNSFYNGNFNLSLVALAVITSAIILTIQSNIVVSLGMVGALSIVRFRTAIKDPLDLVFLFWSISVGIICGAGFAMIAVIASIVLTIIIVIFSILPGDKGSLVLVINAPSYKNEGKIMEVVKPLCSYTKIRARNVTLDSLNLAIEIKTKKQAQLVRELLESQMVISASLVEHDGEITA